MSSPFYAEFKAPAPPAGALAAPTAAVSITVTARPKQTRDAVAARVMGAVATIMGAAVAPDQPLVEAGLDSLGELGLASANGATLCHDDKAHCGASRSCSHCALFEDSTLQLLRSSTGANIFCGEHWEKSPTNRIFGRCCGVAQ